MITNSYRTSTQETREIRAEKICLINMIRGVNNGMAKIIWLKMLKVKCLIGCKCLETRVIEFTLSII